MPSKRHRDRTVIVTGAASGIGRGIATAFAEEGANVVVADVRHDPKQGRHFDTDVTTPTDELIEAEFDTDAIFVKTDVGDHEQASDLIDTTVEAFGSVDVLVNNAGIEIPGLTEEVSIEDWERVINVNLEGTFYCTKFAIPHLKGSEGAIVNIASVHAIDGGAGPSYTSSKAGIVNFTQDLAVELGDANVTANAICPGAIKTPMQRALGEEALEAQREQTLLPRLGEPADIANAAVFLASDEAEWITGDALFVDGGWTSHRGV